MIPRELYFQEELVAFLSDSQIEWPRSDSIYRTNKELKSELADYIQSSVKCSALIDKLDQETRDYIEAEERTFTHLIDSDEWYILDEDGKKHPILVPIFHPENIVVWMPK